MDIAARLADAGFRGLTPLFLVQPPPTGPAAAHRIGAWNLG